MIWFKKKQVSEDQDLTAASKVPQTPSLFQRLKEGLTKTRQQLGNGVQRLLLGKKVLDAELEESLESLLLQADFGLKTTRDLLDGLKVDIPRQQLQNGDVAWTVLKRNMQNILQKVQVPLVLPESSTKPFVILFVGMNGAGKTTSIAKLAYAFQQEGKRVLMAAGDTFRAAAVEQLTQWGQKYNIPLVAQHTGADSSSVLYDAFQAAQARQIHVLLADTAGRLHTQAHLMEELKKVKRVLQKLDPTAPHEVMLVLDASIGQNALVQARQYHEAIGVTGIIMTKLDGTAKGGILFAIANELGIPIRFIGIGEHVDGLRPFDATAFIEAVFHDDSVRASE
ncbi:MAG: signal recognition particle-docking protein FtsY [Legionellaceae bacterium]|nr:signal recognition particle-docking protein FtsY [Legionellaceae bacterium]